ncbi:MAG: CHAT domain-containing protein [Comamonadaceae bacterium]|nr:CHAT domain-containing protein [Comamonadaceae bacterium]
MRRRGGKDAAPAPHSPSRQSSRRPDQAAVCRSLGSSRITRVEALGLVHLPNRPGQGPRRGQHRPPRAFLAAAARSVLVSLWHTDDRATPDLMVAFYREYLDHGHKALARQRAMRAVRAERARAALLGRVHPGQGTRPDQPGSATVRQVGKRGPALGPACGMPLILRRRADAPRDPHGARAAMHPDVTRQNPSDPRPGQATGRPDFLRRFLRLAGPYWSSERGPVARWLLLGVVVLTVGQVTIPVAINLWSERLFDALEQRAMARVPGPRRRARRHHPRQRRHRDEPPRGQAPPAGRLARVADPPAPGSVDGGGPPLPAHPDPGRPRQPRRADRGGHPYRHRVRHRPRPLALLLPPAPGELHPDPVGALRVAGPRGLRLQRLSPGPPGVGRAPLRRGRDARDRAPRAPPGAGGEPAPGPGRRAFASGLRMPARTPCRSPCCAASRASAGVSPSSSARR